MILNYYSHKIVNSKISFGFFTKKGGLSKQNFNSLNCSLSSGDNIKSVKENIRIAQKKLNLENRYIKLVEQNHSNKVVKVNNKNFSKHFVADGIITQEKNICISVLTADCCPIFFYDENDSFICCLHSGWKGCYFNIVENAIKKILLIQPNKKKISAVIGPCLEKNSFEVDKSFKEKFIKKNNNYSTFFQKKNKFEKYLFNMRKLIQYQIHVNKIFNVKNINIGTYKNDKLFFSHRRSTHQNKLPTGRMINIIGFKH